MEEKINFSVTKDGKPLSKDLYNWDEETRTFSTTEDCLVLDFRGIDNCTFKTGSGCTFGAGSYCTFVTGNNCMFKTGSGCTFDTDSYCTFVTGNNCTFNTGWGCTFDTSYSCKFVTGDNCIINAGWGCTFDTGSYCTFVTDNNCTFKTGSDCTFDANNDCTFETKDNCVLIRRDLFEFYDISNKQIRTCPHQIKGYVKDGYYYADGERQYKAIIANGILSEVINHKGNVYKVKNYGEDSISYIIQDGDIYHRGATAKEARESLIYRRSNRDESTKLM